MFMLGSDISDNVYDGSIILSIHKLQYISI